MSILWNRELVVPLENNNQLKVLKNFEMSWVTSVKMQPTEHENYSRVTQELSEKLNDKKKGKNRGEF